MDLPSLLRVLRRHWRVVATVVVLTLGAAATASFLIPPSYRATGTMILLSPAPGDGSNAFAQAGSGVAAEALLSSVNSQSFGIRARDAGIGKEFHVEISARGGGVILVLSTDSDAAPTAMGDFHKLTELLGQELLDVQKRGGATAAFITAQVLSSPIEATPLMGSKYRIIIVIVIFGAAVACALAMALESIAAGKERRRAPPPSLRRSADPAPSSAAVPGSDAYPHASPPQPYPQQPYPQDPYPPQPYPQQPYPQQPYPPQPYPQQAYPPQQSYPPAAYGPQPYPTRTSSPAPSPAQRPDQRPVHQAGEPAPAAPIAKRSPRPATPPDAIRRTRSASPTSTSNGAGAATPARRAAKSAPKTASSRPARAKQLHPDSED